MTAKKYLCFPMILTTLLLGMGCGSVEDVQEIVCTADAKMCPDGSYVSRNPDLGCEFNPCPELRACGAGQPCLGEYGCYDLQDDELGAYCYTGDPCLMCPSGLCDVIETLPAQVVCRDFV